MPMLNHQKVNIRLTTYGLKLQSSLLQAQVFQHHKTKSSEREHPQLDKEMGQTHLNLK